MACHAGADGGAEADDLVSLSADDLVSSRLTAAARHTTAGLSRSQAPMVALKLMTSGQQQRITPLLACLAGLKVALKLMTSVLC